jgi:hypothetical protein
MKNPQHPADQREAKGKQKINGAHYKRKNKNILNIRHHAFLPSLMNRNIFHHADEKVPRFPGTTSFAWISPGPEDLRRAAQKRNSRLATAPRARRLSE